MKLKQLVGNDIALPGKIADLDVTGLTSDSRAVRPGYIFAALPGSQMDGAKFIPQAVENGAAAILLPEKSPAQHDTDCVVITHQDARRAFALMASRFAGSQPQTIVAVTGTNGKTSVASFLRQIWCRLGHSAASLGTVGIQTDGPNRAPTLKKLAHTTPEPVQLHEALATLASDGITHLAMEASSHGLEQRRLDGVTLTAAAFTNISRDHLDYHKDFDDYLAQKLRLFRELTYKTSDAYVIIDADSAGADKALAATNERGLSPFTIGQRGVGIRLIDAKRDGFSQKLTLEYEDQTYQIALPLVGGFQVSNALVAAGLAIASGAEPADVFPCLESLKGAKGRLEHVGTAQSGAPIFVDYAHTPDALKNALLALRPYVKGRLVVIFGCGGDRDKGKRPQMGAVAVKAADKTIVTDDNPRSEDPDAIRAQVMAAANGATEIGDRTQAINSAIADLGEGDVLLVAGKGHETGQIIAGQIIPFSDHEAITTALTSLSEGAQ